MGTLSPPPLHRLPRLRGLDKRPIIRTPYARARSDRDVPLELAQTGGRVVDAADRPLGRVRIGLNLRRRHPTVMPPRQRRTDGVYPPLTRRPIVTALHHRAVLPLTNLALAQLLYILWPSRRSPRERAGASSGAWMKRASPRNSQDRALPQGPLRNHWKVPLRRGSLHDRFRPDPKGRRGRGVEATHSQCTAGRPRLQKKRVPRKDHHWRIVRNTRGFRHKWPRHFSAGSVC